MKHYDLIVHTKYWSPMVVLVDHRDLDIVRRAL